MGGGKIIPQQHTVNPMRYRKLRIAISVTCGIACVLLIVGWGRSRGWYDSFVYQFGTKAFEECSCDGQLHVGVIKTAAFADGPLVTRHHPIKDMTRWLEEIPQKQTNVLGFGSINDAFEWVAIIPFWFLCIASGCCSAALWPIKPWRFRVRTLLVATTLIAVVLGLAVYAAGK